MYESIGAKRVIHTRQTPATHNMCTARMSKDPRDGVVNAHGQTHDITNLFISDGSAMTTPSSANPTLTIVALALRQAEFISETNDRPKPLGPQQSLSAAPTSWRRRQPAWLRPARHAQHLRPCRRRRLFAAVLDGVDRMVDLLAGALSRALLLAGSHTQRRTSRPAPPIVVYESCVSALRN